MKSRILFTAFILLSVNAYLSAQTLKEPKSFKYRGNVLHVDKVDRVEKHFDSLVMGGGGRRRVAEPMELDISIDTAGTLEELPDGGGLWRCRVDSGNAHFMSFKFSEFYLPPGAELYFVSIYRDFQVGPFTGRHNQPTGRFGSPVIAGDASVIELYIPHGCEKPTLTLESVSHGYRNALGMGKFSYRKNVSDSEKIKRQPRNDDKATAMAGEFGCQRDINCPEGAPFQNEKRAVGEGYDGTYICSGQLVNNVRQDNKYYYLTAGHCEWNIDPSTMGYYWNYENSGCGTNDYPGWTYNTGSVSHFHSYTDALDMNLLELTGTGLETTFNFYYMGWNRDDSNPPTSCSMISHPADKPKQIVIRNSSIINCATGSCGGGWGPTYWRVTSWDVGVDEGGSSGGGLMDQNHLLIGTLTGGVGTDCVDFIWDEFCKLSAGWNHIKAWLDPDNTGAMSVPGKDHTDVGVIPEGDITGDGDIDEADLSIMASQWLQSPGTPSADIYPPAPDGDDIVNLMDFSVLALHWKE